VNRRRRRSGRSRVERSAASCRAPAGARASVSTPVCEDASGPSRVRASRPPTVARGNPAPRRSDGRTRRRRGITPLGIAMREHGGDGSVRRYREALIEAQRRKSRKADESRPFPPESSCECTLRRAATRVACERRANVGCRPGAENRPLTRESVVDEQPAHNPVSPVRPVYSNAYRAMLYGTYSDPRSVCSTCHRSRRGRVDELEARDTARHDSLACSLALTSSHRRRPQTRGLPWARIVICLGRDEHLV